MPHEGVCKARNAGLKYAKNDWIAYVDSDNTIMPCFLGVFAKGIVDSPSSRVFYAQYQVKNREFIDWGKYLYSLSRIYYRNFIDLGVYVHDKQLINELGGFDESMCRLVDWELILRQCKNYHPNYIPIDVMFYNNDDNSDRITKTVKDVNNIIEYVHKKHEDCINKFKSVTTIILTYN